MKVLMLTSSYPIDGSNLGSFIRNIAQGVSRKNIDVTVLIFTASNKKKKYKDGLVKVIEYPYSLFLPPYLHKYPGLLPSMKNSIVAKVEFPLYLLSSLYHLKKFIYIGTYKF